MTDEEKSRLERRLLATATMGTLDQYKRARVTYEVLTRPHDSLETIAGDLGITKKTLWVYRVQCDLTEVAGENMERIEEARRLEREEGLTPAEIGERMGVHRTTVYNWLA